MSIDALCSCHLLLIRVLDAVTWLRRLFDAQNSTMHNGGNYFLETALHEYLLQVSADPNTMQQLPLSSICTSL